MTYWSALRETLNPHAPRVRWDLYRRELFVGYAICAVMAILIVIEAVMAVIGRRDWWIPLAIGFMALLSVLHLEARVRMKRSRLHICGEDCPGDLR